MDNLVACGLSSDCFFRYADRPALWLFIDLLIDAGLTFGLPHRRLVERLFLNRIGGGSLGAFFYQFMTGRDAIIYYQQFVQRSAK